MVLFPGCACCDACTDEVGPLCSYRVSVDGGTTWTDVPCQVNAVRSVSLPPIDVQGFFATPTMTASYTTRTGFAAGRNRTFYDLLVTIEWLYPFDGARVHSCRIDYTIVSTFNTAPTPDRFEWSGRAQLTLLFAAGQFPSGNLQNAFVEYLTLPFQLVPQCVSDTNRDCGALTGRRFYMPDPTEIIQQFDGSQMTWSTSAPTAISGAGVFDSIAMVANGTETNTGRPVTFADFGNAWDFVANLRLLIQTKPDACNPLP